MEVNLPVWMLAVLVFCGLTVADVAGAQIVPDNTLPENSRVEAGCRNCTIEGGTRQGNNLFHSFREFSIPTGGSAHFNNAADIRNILTRVTGNSASNIDGLLRSNGAANLFLINPNGIIFGPNARLDIGGSFLASTADAIEFDNQEFFSATNPEAPTLLTVQPSALLFNQMAVQAIEVQAGGFTDFQRTDSLVRAFVDFSNRSSPWLYNSPVQVIENNYSQGLQVAPGRSLVLLGGDVTLNNGSLTAPGGRIELAGIAGSGRVDLTVDGAELQLDGLDRIAQSNVRLNQSVVDTTAAGGGSVAITAANLNVENNSEVRSGIGAGLGTAGAQTGNVTLNTTGTTTIGQLSAVRNRVGVGGIGNAGDLRITTGTLNVQNGSILDATTNGQGNAGNIAIAANNRVVFGGVTEAGLLNYAFSDVGRTGTGQGGNIEIITGSFSLRDGSQISTGTFGRGNGGSITINARNQISLDGSATVGITTVPSGLYNPIELAGVGNTGDIRLSSRSLSLTNGAVLIDGVVGAGDSGNIVINTQGLTSIEGYAPLTEATLAISPTANSIPSGAYTSVVAPGQGQGGDIYVTTGSLALRQGGQLLTLGFGVGASGDVVIDARDAVLFDGYIPNGDFVTGAVTAIEGNSSVRQAGDIHITADSLFLRNGASLFSYTNAQGTAGDVIIDARDTVLMDGFVSGTRDSRRDGRGSVISSDVLQNGIGRGGDVRITTSSLTLRDGATISAFTVGQGDAGRVIITARDRISIDGVGRVGFSSGFQTGSFGKATGRGGTIRLNAGSLSLSNGGAVTARTDTANRGGDITITTDNLNIASGGQILTSSRSGGQAGDIILDVANDTDLSGQDPSYARRVDRFGLDFVDPVSASSGIYANTLANPAAQGGNIRLNTNQLTVADHAAISVSSPNGQAGDVTIAANSIYLNQGRLTARTARSNGNTGANIALQNVDLLQMENNSLISAQARDRANGGNININAENGFVVAVPDENSDIIASAERGNGGRIDITAQDILGLQESEVRSTLSEVNASSQFGTAGTIAFNTPDVDPDRGLAELPETVVDASQLVALGCTPGATRQANQGEFYQTGRSGIAPLPTDALSSSDILEDLQPPDSWNETTAANAPIQEAQGWQVNDRGQVVLLAEISAPLQHCRR